MKTIQWGIIGCGDVTEVKSGPAFNKVPRSKLVAVMRRNADKAKDYAKRHNVSKWYTDAYQLINDPDINAIYVATPPLQHEEYTIASLHAGKPVYVEKPMAVSEAAGKRMVEAANTNGVKLCVAHYRRAQPLFLKIKELLAAKTIGDIRFVDLKCLAALLSPDKLNESKTQWRVDPAVSGGGLFHDLAPHQLDLMLYFFGKIKEACGLSANQAGLYKADDIVAGTISFEDGTIFNGLWCFSVSDDAAKDVCEITGTKGKLTFSVFGEPELNIKKNGQETKLTFEKLEHVQSPMIEKVVEYFLDDGKNLCSGEDGVEVMRIMELLTLK